MARVSYAQNFEDVLLWRALGDVEKGRYLDIGAQDPEVDSVSLIFHQADWRGVHVEPTPAYAEKLRSARPRDMVLQAAVAEGSDPIDLVEFLGTGLSTGDAKIAARHSAAGFANRTIASPTISLKQLLNANDEEFHWVKIDVEGMEPAVLRSWGDSPRRPWLFLVEATAPLSSQATHAKWIGELETREYQEVFFDGLSRYFLHKSQLGRKTAFAAPANVFDDFIVTRRHFAARGLAAELDQVQEEAAAQIAEADDLRSKVATVENALTAEMARSAGLLEQLERAEAQRSETYQSWVKAQDFHRQALEQAETRHLAMIEDARREVMRQHVVERERERDRVRQLSDLGDQVAEAQERAERLDEHLAASVAREDDLQTALDQLAEQFAEIERQRHEAASQLVRANALIAQALAVPESRWQRLGRLIGLDPINRAQLLLGAWSVVSAPMVIKPEESAVPVVPTQPPVEPAHYASTLGELLALDGREFVRSAYATMLGREADEEGQQYYLNRIEAGTPKLQVLHQMRQSRESRLFPDPLPGLQDTFRRYRSLARWQGRRAAAERVEALIKQGSAETHVGQFMEYFDEDFVRVAYLFYLDREPEPGGLADYTTRLRRGASRQRVLLDIAGSAEAKKVGRQAAGQRALQRAVRLDSLPVVGTLIGIWRMTFGVKRQVQEMRALQNHLYRLSKKVA